jgi:RNA polymerase sigma-70 factor (ECF subfamily)
MTEGSQRESAAALYELHYAALAGWASFMLGSDADGHDVAAEAFTRLYARFWSVRDAHAFLYTVATNIIRDRWRRDRRHAALGRRLVQRSSDLTAPEPDTGMADLIHRLPEKLRWPIVLHYYVDLPVAEVAHILRKPTGTVKRLLAEGRAALATQIREAHDA